MESHLSVLITFFSEHPQSALAVIFCAALLEALAVIGTVIPGSSIVFIGGALAGLNALDPWWTAAVAVAGAILGDGISYWLGQHYHERIRGLWPIRKYPAVLEQGQAYFARHGGKSVFFGRFLGPVRAIVPVVAGMSGMPAVHFYLINVVSAFAWVAAHLVPGILFGASLQLAGAVSSRLLILLLVLGAFLWGITELVRLAFRYGWPRLAALRYRVLEHAYGRSGSAAKALRLLFDPSRASVPALLGAALLLAAGAWIFFALPQQMVAQLPLYQLDQVIYDELQGLRSEWGDALMLGTSAFGGRAVLLPLVLAVALFLGYRQAWRTCACWLAAVAGATLTVWFMKYTVAWMHPAAMHTGVAQLSSPSHHTLLSVVVYGLLAFLLARGRPLALRIGLTLLAACAVMLIAFSRLYLGVHWFSDVLASLFLGLAWLALLAMAYGRRVHGERVHGLQLGLIALSVTLLAGGWHIGSQQDAAMARHAPQLPAKKLLADWQTSGWRLLPAARSELDGGAEEPFSVQWAAASRTQISSALTAGGWQPAPAWTFRTSLLWLLPDTDILQLPVLPKFDYGAPSRLTYVKALTPHERMVLRLWPSRYVVEGAERHAPHLLWHGTATIERLYRPAGLMTLARTEADFNAVPNILSRDLQGRLWTAQREARRGGVLLIW